MAIYRPPRPRWPVALAVGAAGLVGGLLVGLALAGGADPRAAAEEARTQLARASSLLEVAGVEYEEAVEDGGVVATPEYSGALDAVAASRDAAAEALPVLEVLAPERAADLEAGYRRLAGLMDPPAPAEDVAPAIADLRALLVGQTD